MSYQWGRLIWWLAQGQNAAAVQALTAVVVTILTGVLIWITWKYAGLTQEVMRLQIAAAFQPDVNLIFTGLTLGGALDHDRLSDSITGTLRIVNTGRSPIKLHTVHIFLHFAEKLYSDSEKAMPYANPVISPDQSKEIMFQFEAKFGASRSEHRLQAVILCTDLIETSHHLFETIAGGTISHFPGNPKYLPKQLKALGSTGGWHRSG
jgi:hypothetical protein